MELNKKKCGIMLISAKSNTFTKKEINKQNILNIEFVKNYKYLGINFNKSLNPILHISYLKDKLNSYFKMIYTIKRN